MVRSYETWKVGGYMRPVIEWTGDGEPVNAGYSEPVVVVFDPRGWEWHVTAEGDKLTSLTVRGEIDQAALRLVPLRSLQEVATAYLGHVQQAVSKGLPLADALSDAEHESEVRVSDKPPSPTEFTKAWDATPVAEVRGGQRITRRRALADRYSVTVYTIDKWTRAARDNGLIEQSNVGRPRNPETPGGKPSPGRERKNRK